MTKDMLVHRHFLPTTSTPVGSRVQPMLALNRGATFSGYDSKLRSSARGQVDAADVANGCPSSNDSRCKFQCTSTDDNCSVIQFSPDKQHCSTPTGRGSCVHATARGFVLRNELPSNSSFCYKSHCATRVGRHASINRSSTSCFDDRLRKPEKFTGGFLSGTGLGFLQKLSRGSARSASPNHSCCADVSTVSVKRRSSLRDSFKRIFLSRRFAWNILLLNDLCLCMFCIAALLTVTSLCTCLMYFSTMLKLSTVCHLYDNSLITVVRVVQMSIGNGTFGVLPPPRNPLTNLHTICHG